MFKQEQDNIFKKETLSLMRTLINTILGIISRLISLNNYGNLLLTKMYILVQNLKALAETDFKRILK